MLMSRKRTATLTPSRMVTAVRMMRQQATTRRALGGKRGHCGVGAVHGDESDDPILALMRHFNLPVTREDYLSWRLAIRSPGTSSPYMVNVRQ